MKKPTKELLRKTYCAELTLSEETAQALNRLSCYAVILWNMALAVCMKWLDKETLKEERKTVTAFSLNYWLSDARKTERLVPADIPELPLDELSCDMSREVLRKLAGSFQSWFELVKKKDRRAKQPREKSLEYFLTLSWSSFKIIRGSEEAKLIVPTASGAKLEIDLGPYLFAQIEGKEVKHVTISRRENGKYKISLVCGSPLPEVNLTPATVRAIDIGAGDIAVSDSSGNEFLIPARRPDKFWRKQTSLLDVRIKKCTKGSRAWKRRMNARRTMHSKSGSQHKDHQRKLAYSLVDGAQAIVVGKMQTRLGLAKSAKGTTDQHWGAQNTGYHQRLLTFIKEKAAERGIPVLELPDPKRKGELDDPDAKFRASQALLCKGCAEFKLEAPSSFVRSIYVLNQ